MEEKKPAFVTGSFETNDWKFHCPCGAAHSRGYLNGVDVCRCLKCGKTYKVKAEAILR
jgi:hypothetical protein